MCLPSKLVATFFFLDLRGFFPAGFGAGGGSSGWGVAFSGWGVAVSFFFRRRVVLEGACISLELASGFGWAVAVSGLSLASDSKSSRRDERVAASPALYCSYSFLISQ